MQTKSNANPSNKLVIGHILSEQCDVKHIRLETQLYSSHISIYSDGSDYHNFGVMRALTSRALEDNRKNQQTHRQTRLSTTSHIWTQYNGGRR
jgi:hypothetical protein